MKLSTSIEDLRLRHTFTISRGSQDVCRVVIARVEDGKHTGYGEASPSSFYAEDVDSVVRALDGVRGSLEGRDPTRFRDLLSDAAESLGPNRAALCALDTAVLDWASRELGAPLWRMLGLDPTQAPPSSFTIGIDTPERMVEKLREAKALGYGIYKVKLGTGDDVDIVRRLRAESDAVLRVDANCAWTVRETIEKSRELAALGVEFIEQPLPPTELDAMEEVYAKSALPIVADESSIAPEDVPDLQGRFHGINIKLVKCGGILPALRMVHLARTFGMKVMFGCMIESSVGITAAAQLGGFADWLDLDGNVLITNDPFAGVENHAGRLVLPSGWVERR